MKVLLIDDEQSILDIFGEILKGANYAVITATNGKDTLDKAISEKPDVIICDQILPDMNGNQILMTLKQNETTKNIPISILSNYSQDTLMQEAIKLGAVDYILKYQIEPSDLVQKVQQMLQGGNSGAGTIISNNSTQTPPVSTNQISSSAEAPLPQSPSDTHVLS